MNTATLPLRNSMNRSASHIALVLIPLALACFAFLPSTDAQCPETCDGNQNTAVGDSALISNTTGFNNTAIGDTALSNNTTGTNNTATGYLALASNTTGYSDTAIGFYALQNNTTGSLNIAIGTTAGAFTTTGSNNIDIGHNGISGESNTIRIGKRGVQNTTVIAGIRGATVSGGIAVMIDGNGRLGTTTSSARFKEAVKPMDKASETLFALKPVTFRYKQDLDPEGIPQFGLVAEEVEKVNPHLVARDEQGKPYTVRYEAVNAMLLNEFLKEHRKNEKQEATIAQLTSALAKEQATVAQQRKDFEAAIAQVKAQVQKVSAQLELNKSAPQVVKNP